MRLILLGHNRRSPLEIDINPPGILLGRVLQAELLAHLLDAGFDLLDVVGGVVAFAYDAKAGCWVSRVCGLFGLQCAIQNAERENGGRKGEPSHMQPPLPRPLRVSNPLLDNLLRLAHELPVQIDRVPVHPALRVVLPEYVVRRLLVVLVHHRAVPFAFVGELVRGGAVAAGVGLVGLRGGVLLGGYGGGGLGKAWGGRGVCGDVLGGGRGERGRTDLVEA